MRTRFRYDPDLEAVVEIRDSSNYFEEKAPAPGVISDDVGAGVNGLRHMPSGKNLDSKSAHRAENRARGLVEVGGETNFADKREPLKADTFMREVKDATEQLQSNYNGVRDERARERLITQFMRRN